MPSAGGDSRRAAIQNRYGVLESSYSPAVRLQRPGTNGRSQPDRAALAGRPRSTLSRARHARVTPERKQADSRGGWGASPSSEPAVASAAVPSAAAGPCADPCSFRKNSRCPAFCKTSSRTSPSPYSRTSPRPLNTAFSRAIRGRPRPAALSPRRPCAGFPECAPARSAASVRNPCPALPSRSRGCRGTPPSTAEARRSRSVRSARRSPPC